MNANQASILVAVIGAVAAILSAWIGLRKDTPGFLRLVFAITAFVAITLFAVALFAPSVLCPLNIIVSDQCPQQPAPTGRPIFTAVPTEIPIQGRNTEAIP
jgi:hypothetical protein